MINKQVVEIQAKTAYVSWGNMIQFTDAQDNEVNVSLSRDLLLELNSKMREKSEELLKKIREETKEKLEALEPDEEFSNTDS
jgi:vacuolar-type H+-ATPase subunit E/Vma4